MIQAAALPTYITMPAPRLKQSGFIIDQIKERRTAEAKQVEDLRLVQGTAVGDVFDPTAIRDEPPCLQVHLH